MAQEQYDAIGNEEYETERLRRLFAAFECTAELNAELLQSTVSAVLVTRQTVRLQLKNGQSLERKILYDRRKAARHYHSTKAGTGSRTVRSNGSSAWRRTAAFSTKEEEQASSYEAQCQYYTDKIMSNKEWTMAGIFADEGISGTSTKKRTEFPANDPPMQAEKD